GERHDRPGANRARHGPAVPAADDDAERKADEGGERQRRQREDGGVHGALGNEIADRTVVKKGVAEVEPHRVCHPIAVLDGERLVEPVPLARLLETIAPRPFEAERAAREIARHGAGQQQRRRRHRDDQEEGEREAADDVAGQFLLRPDFTNGASWRSYQQPIGPGESDTEPARRWSGAKAPPCTSYTQ